MRIVIFSVLLLLGTGAAQEQCPARSALQDLLQESTNLVAKPGNKFPTRNSLMAATAIKWVKVPAKNKTADTGLESSKEMNATEPSSQNAKARSKSLQEQEIAEPKQKSNSTVIQNLVFFFHAPGCPYSAALRPVMECVPKYFSETKVAFISQDNSGPPAPNFKGGVIATPAVKAIDQAEAGYNYDGPRQLSSIVEFVQNSTGVEAVAWPLSASGQCAGLPACYCDFNAQEVTPQQIAASTSNVWMLLSLAFTAYFSWAYAFQK